MYAHYFFTFSLFLVSYAKIILPSSLSFSPNHLIYYLQLKKFCHSIIVFNCFFGKYISHCCSIAFWSRASFNNLNIFIHTNYVTFYIPYLKFLVSLIIKMLFSRIYSFYHLNVSRETFPFYHLILILIN